MCRDDGRIKNQTCGPKITSVRGQTEHRIKKTGGTEKRKRV